MALHSQYNTGIGYPFVGLTFVYTLFKDEQTCMEEFFSDQLLLSER